jgi:predicted RNase H-like HicB family nuclease
VTFDDYNVVLFWNQPEGWMAEIPAIPGCYALMPAREEALAELACVFQMIADEYAQRNQTLPADTTSVVNASARLR